MFLPLNSKGDYTAKNHWLTIECSIESIYFRNLVYDQNLSKALIFFFYCHDQIRNFSIDVNASNLRDRKLYFVLLA